MPLVIQIQTGNSPLTAQTATVKLAGSLDTATAPHLETQLATLLVGPVKELVFDLAQLTFISSAGLRVIAGARKRLRERDGLLHSFICNRKSRKFLILSLRFPELRFSKMPMNWINTWPRVRGRISRGHEFTAVS